jgi:hypothetical protein
MRQCLGLERINDCCGSVHQYYGNGWHLSPPQHVVVGWWWPLWPPTVATTSAQHSRQSAYGAARRWWCMLAPRCSCMCRVVAACSRRCRTHLPVSSPAIPGLRVLPNQPPCQGVKPMGNTSRLVVPAWPRRWERRSAPASYRALSVLGAPQACGSACDARPTPAWRLDAADPFCTRHRIGPIIEMYLHGHWEMYHSFDAELSRGRSLEGASSESRE